MATTSIMDLDCWEEGPPKSHETVTQNNLKSELPFPHGILLPETVSAEEFGALDEAHQDELANKCPSGRLLDGLIMLIRALMACGIDGWDNGLDGRDKRLVKDTRLWDIAAHRWGYKRYNDFAMKGHLFAILRDTAGASGDQSYNPTMHELLHHPLVAQTIWGHPHMHFFERTMALKKEGTDECERVSDRALLDDVGFEAEQAFRLPFCMGPDVGLPSFFGDKLCSMGIQYENRKYEVASTLPNVIPVIMSGGRPFNDVRCFWLEGEHWVPVRTPGTEELVPQFFAAYVLNLVLNLDNGDARHYQDSTRAIRESLAVAPGENEQHKVARAKSNATWNFGAPESRATEFLLLFRRVPDSGVRPEPWTIPTHNPIHTWSGEYSNPMMWDTFVPPHLLKVREGNPMAIWGLNPMVILGLQKGPLGSQGSE